MSIDVYVAFGGVAFLGFVGFWIAWFSHPTNDVPSESATASKKQLITEEIAEVEKKLHKVSAHIAQL